MSDFKMLTNPEDMDKHAIALQILSMSYTMRANPLIIIDLLKGYLFTEEECGELKEIIRKAVNDGITV